MKRQSVTRANGVDKIAGRRFIKLLFLFSCFFFILAVQRGTCDLRS